MTVLSGDYSIILYEPRWKDQVVELQTRLWDPENWDLRMLYSDNY